MTVAENVLLGNFPLRANKSVDWKKLNEKARGILALLGEEIPVTQKAGHLSIAEQQIVEIAKALSVRSKILIMDEPTAALNDQETSKLFRLLRKLKESGVAIIYITHRFSEMYELADRVTVMRDGETVGTVDVNKVTDDILVQMMVGQGKNAVFHRTLLPVGEEILAIRGLNVAESLRDINLHVNQGEIVVIFGMVGAGQTELFRAIYGDLHIASGEIRLHQHKVNIRSIRNACDQGIGYVSDDRKNEGIIPLLSVQENICLPAYARKLKRYGFVRWKKAEALAQSFFTKLQVKCKSIDQSIASLSGGNQQKCVLGRWLANDSKVMLLNMPTRGVDVGARAEIYRVLEDLAARGIAVLIVSLEMPEVISIADRVYIMREFQIVAEVGREDITQETLLYHAFGLDISKRQSQAPEGNSPDGKKV
jgi:ABC-type sugar transport system ATPase subunit